jgi:tRNA threonylcarbamoyladenosine biosynthesis protein TsaB
MITLAFDTAMGAGSAIVDQDGATLALRVEANSRALAEQLVPMVEATLDAAGHSYLSVDRIGVTLGPGTFTGMRIGIAAARAMALASDKPLVGVSTLEVIARQAADDYPTAPCITACFDARRGEVYLQSFDQVEGRLLAASDPSVLLVGEAQAQLSDTPGVVVGTGSHLMAPIEHLQCLGGYDRIDPHTLARIVRTRPEPAEMPLPLYLRAPDAKLPGGKNLGAP